MFPNWFDDNCTFVVIKGYKGFKGNNSYEKGFKGNNSYEKGYDNSYEKGYDNSYEKGYDNSYGKGYDNSYGKGYDNSYGKGFNNMGYDNSYENGYNNIKYDNSYSKVYNNKGYNNSYGKGFKGNNNYIQNTIYSDNLELVINNRNKIKINKELLDNEQYEELFDDFISKIVENFSSNINYNSFIAFKFIKNEKFNKNLKYKEIYNVIKDKLYEKLDNKYLIVVHFHYDINKLKEKFSHENEDSNNNKIINQEIETNDEEQIEYSYMLVYIKSKLD